MFWIDLFKRKKATVLHFLIFVWWSIALILFSINTEILNTFWSYFWLARWADLIVYISIILIFYLYIWLYNKFIKQQYEQTRLIRAIAINQAEWWLWSAEVVAVIPAWNEPDTAIPVIQHVIDQWYWVVFVDDWSSNTLYNKIQKKIISDKLVLVKHIINMWQWAALQTWFDFVQQYINKNKNNLQYVATYDSDWQQDIKELSRFLNAFKQDPKLDIVIGSRFLEKNQEKIPWFRKNIILKWWRIFTGLISGLWLTDTHNGYRLLKVTTLSKIKITLNGMSHASEITDQMKTEKLNYKEVPVTVKYEWIRPSLVQSNRNAISVASKMLYKKLFFR